MPNTHSTLTSLFSDIADAIRDKKGTSADIVADDFPDEIASISGGGITPSGSVTLTEENTYDVTEKAEAVVDFSATRANLAEAVTAKGVDTLPTASFDTIATNIALIEGGGGGEWERITMPTTRTDNFRIYQDLWPLGQRKNGEIFIARKVSGDKTSNNQIVLIHGYSDGTNGTIKNARMIAADGNGLFKFTVSIDYSMDGRCNAGDVFERIIYKP